MVWRRNVLIFHSGALGDFILTWPLALAAGRLFPQSRIVYVTAGQKGALAERAIGVEHVDAEGGWHGLFGDGTLPDRATKLLAGAHTIFSFVARPGDAWEANVRRAAPEAQLRLLEPRPPEGFARHSTEFLLDQLAGRPVVHEAMRQILRSIAERGLGYRAAADGSAMIHPGSGSPTKCWPAERFVTLAERLRAQGRWVQIVLGEVEQRFEEAVIREFERVAQVIRPRTYCELWDHLHAGSAFIGNDSGPGHLAGILGAPTVSIFGPSDPAVWRPLGPNIRVIRGEPIDAIDVESVSRLCS